MLSKVYFPTSPVIILFNLGWVYITILAFYSLFAAATTGGNCGLFDIDSALLLP